MEADVSLVVSASKSGAVSPRRSVMFVSSDFPCAERLGGDSTPVLRRRQARARQQQQILAKKAFFLI